MTENAAAAASVDLLAIARRIALAAAEAALEERRKGISVAATKSTPTDVVTAVDRDTEERIRSMILDARPDDGIFGEEDDTHVGSSGLNWVVDPIDGTVNLLYDIPAWSVSIAVVDGPPDPGHWHALAGIVVNPVTGEVFEASVGGGARLVDGQGERELRVNDDVHLSGALVATGFGYAADRRAAQAAVLVDVLPRIRDIRRIGSAALDLGAVAAGRLDAFYEQGLNPWDHAAGALIVREAGGRVGGLGGAAESDRMLVAAPPSLFDDLTALLGEAGA
ncbi:inositol monophosphatase family protein [Agromyces binzhouensis]|uniref:inositol-phosphate phosphatase n=1 Tax=Agromyces binzhouensis TaxID=1817495 RepID=A0A4V1QQS4_9MICO|nr:inositol monophosphatase family protein [Agromyces binzhouensis]RXZ41493.1 inositol monophosphatase [Agromyces binzhouensis]